MTIKILKNNIVCGGPAVQIPAHLSIGQFLLDKFRDNEERYSMVNAECDQKCTNREFIQLAVNLASGLRNLGIGYRDVVCLCSENRLEYMVTTVAVLLCGGVVTTASNMYTEGELQHVLNISKPKCIFGSASTLKNNFQTFQSLSFVKHIVCFDESISGVQGNFLFYNKLNENIVNVDEFEVTNVKGAVDPALILYSSGTTGLPKGVMISNVNFLHMVMVTNNSSPEQQRFLTIVPWYHGYGLMVTMSYMLAGKTMVFMNGFNPEKYLQTIEKYKIHVLLTVPPIVLFLTKSPMVDNYNLTSVTMVWCGAAPLTSEITKTLLEKLPCCRGVMQAYGMTETSMSVSSDTFQRLHLNRPGSGGAPLAGTRMKVVDIVTQQPLGPHATGEICVKGPGVMLGYVGDPAATAEAFDHLGYLRTGDIGYYDEDGFFFIVDRLKELIKYKGFQVPPAEVESAVLRHAAVAECGVAGAPHAAAGELATAFVALRPPHQPSDKLADDIKLCVAQQLSTPKHLHGGVIFVKEVPKNPSGKILRRVLRDRLRQAKSKL